MFEATARLRIREGELEGFKHQAAELARQVRGQDEKPLRYDWFLSEDGTECEVREAYPDADALLAHQRRIAEAKAKLFRDFVEGHTMAFYGEPSPALAAALDAMSVAFTRFRFLQGLDAEREEATMFEVTARLTVREGELDGFKQQVAEIMRLTRERDTKTLRYDWFLSEDGRECEVREAYVDADGLLEHHHHIAEAKAELFRRFADGHHMTFYAEPSPALAEAIEHIPGVEITQLSFFQGLEVGVLDGAPA